jgi:integrase
LILGRHGTGVELRANSIRLSFVYEGEPCRETLRIPPTPANEKYAIKLAANMRRAIANGTFVYAEFFPDSPRAQKEGPKTFGAAAGLYVKAIGQLTAATRDQYENAIEEWKVLLGAATPLHQLTHAVLKAKIGSHPWKSAKRMNNALIPLRGVFGMLFPGPQAVHNPMNGITNTKVVKKKPDPLTAAERDKVLADLRERYDDRIYAYFLWMFFTGMRPEEAIALRWSDIDFNAGMARVQRVRTFKGSERDGSKTHAERDVDLVAQAMEALKIMAPYTKMLSVEREDDEDTAAEIFQNPVMRRPWHDERSQRDHYWKPSLKRLGIRARRAYSTRHTYCTVALMGRVNPAYIAQQAGHSLKMLLEVYARWIPGADGGAERDVLAAAMAGNSSPILPQTGAKGPSSEGEDGRRDWTRTNPAGRARR